MNEHDPYQIMNADSDRFILETSTKRILYFINIKYSHKADIHWTFEADISSENNPDQKVKLSVSK